MLVPMLTAIFITSDATVDIIYDCLLNGFYFAITETQYLISRTIL